MVEVDLLLIVLPITLSTASLITTIWIFHKNADKVERKETIDLAAKVAERLADLDKRLSRIEWKHEQDESKGPIHRR